MTGRTGLERKDGRQEITMSVFACLFQVFFRFGGGGGGDTDVRRCGIKIFSQPLGYQTIAGAYLVLGDHGPE